MVAMGTVPVPSRVVWVISDRHNEDGQNRRGGRLIERTKGMAVVLLAIALGCTVGEARTEGPGLPGAEPTPGEASPRVRPTPEAERLAGDLAGRAVVAYEAGDLTQALAAAVRALETYPGTAGAEQSRWVAARAAFGLGEYGQARDHAEAFRRRVAADSPEAQDARRLVELAEDALAGPGTASPVVGAVLPRTGSRAMVQYGDWVLEGIELAVRQEERRSGRSIQLVVADDGGGTRTAAAVAELERRGVVAVIGPLLPQQLPEVAGARTDPRLVFVSPTITDAPAHWSSMYSVAGGDTRGAQTLGRYAADMGLRDAAILHARGLEYQRRAQAFAAEYEALGGRVLATVPYDSGTTTFAPHMRQILSVVPQAGGAARSRGEDWEGRRFALFVTAPDRDVPQIAPQIGYYGLTTAGAQVLGDEAWASPAVRRVIPNRDMEGVVTASPLAPGRAESVADPDFVTLFEQTYRRSLTNQLPALGYDAAHMVLQALPNRLLTVEATTRRFEMLTGIHGATGTLSVRAARLVRTPHLATIRDGALTPAPLPPQPGPTGEFPGP
jgi:branched-chain amino acid transport system substrate-binding protein